MQPSVTETPVPRDALAGYKVLFDAVYTPMETQLLKDAQEQGATAVSGVEMFVGQAADQFELFTGAEGESG
jgi:3-dehydroquinate dehydratase/shikimate dehydrogenase